MGYLANRWAVHPIGFGWVFIFDIGYFVLATVDHCILFVVSGSAIVCPAVRKDQNLQNLQDDVESKEVEQGIVTGAFFIWG